MLKNEYEEGIQVTAALKLAVKVQQTQKLKDQYNLPNIKGETAAFKVLIKSMDSTTASADKLEFCVLSREGETVNLKLKF